MKKLLSLLSVLIITGTSIPTTIAASNYEKKANSKILNRTKRENMIDNDFSFVEKIYDNNKNIWNLSLVLSKYNWEKIINAFIQNNKSNFIVKTKKIITEIKNNSLNLSAQAFDEGNIDAFAHHIWNYHDYYKRLIYLQNNELIRINLYIEDFNYKKYEKLALIIKSNNDFSFVEKIYDNNKNIWNLSLVLSKNKWEQIVNLFIKNRKKNFVAKTKKIIITKIKNKSLNLSAQAFDERNIDAFAHHIWKNFNHYYNLMSNIGISQLGGIFVLYIDNKGNYIRDDNFVKFIGKKSNLEISQEISKNINNNNSKKCKIKNGSFLWGDSVEKSTSSKIKIKINKLTWSKIFILFYLLKNKDIFIKTITELFKTFSPSYNDVSYKLNEEELQSFSYLIWKNFSYYYDVFLNLKNNELIRITSYSTYPEGYWTSENFYYYNEVVDKNNNVIDWTTFNTTNNSYKFYFQHEHNFEVFNRVKKPNSNKIELDSIILKRVLDKLPNLKILTIFRRFSELNPNIDVEEISIISISNNYIFISAKPNSKYNGSVIIKLETENLKKPSQLKINQYDVPGDNNCLFWAVATSYLLPVRNAEVEFRNRFIQLFGEENLDNLSYIQTFMRNFDINNQTSNQNWYRNPIAIKLITRDFRNRVVDYIRDNRERFELDITYNEFHNNLFEGYLRDMRETTSWGGGIEIQAMTYILNLQIFVNNIRIRQEDFENFIQIFRVNENHYNFALSTISTVHNTTDELPQTDIFSNTNIRNAVIDLRPQMPIPMEFQRGERWCSMATIKNVMDNALIKEKELTLTQEQLVKLFSKAGFKINDKGMCRISVPKFLNENNFITRNLGYYYSGVDLSTELFRSVLSINEKLILIQNLIWESLSRGTPIILSINGNAYSRGHSIGHSVLIVGIIPNEDPFQTLYFLRDPSPMPSLGSIDPNDALNTETSMLGEDIYDSLFFDKDFVPYMLINSDVFTMNLIPQVIKYFLNHWNFQNLLSTPRNSVRNPLALNFSGDLLSLSSIDPSELSYLIEQELCEIDNDDIYSNSTSES